MEITLKLYSLKTDTHLDILSKTNEKKYRQYLYFNDYLHGCQ